MLLVQTRSIFRAKVIPRRLSCTYTWHKGGSKLWGILLYWSAKFFWRREGHFVVCFLKKPFQCNIPDSVHEQTGLHFTLHYTLPLPLYMLPTDMGHIERREEATKTWKRGSFLSLMQKLRKWLHGPFSNLMSCLRLSPHKHFLFTKLLWHSTELTLGVPLQHSSSHCSKARGLPSPISSLTYWHTLRWDQQGSPNSSQDDNGVSTPARWRQRMLNK